MKNIYFILFLFTISLNSQSQNLTLFNSEGNIPNGGTINSYGLVDENVIYSYINVVNTSSSALIVKVIRHNISVISGSNNYFCWGQCFGPLDDTSLISKQILANDTSYEFQGEYEPRMIAGTSVVRYVFYNINNTTDTVSATVNYIAEPLGIDNNGNDNNEISNAYPNPANDITTVKYILPKNANSAKLIISDCLGAIVKTQPLSNNSNKTTINLNDLGKGIYFYSIIVDNSMLFTHKLVVK